MFEQNKRFNGSFVICVQQNVFFFKITEYSEVKEDAGRTCHICNTVNNSTRRF